MDKKLLLESCVGILDSFDIHSQSADSHVDLYFSTVEKTIPISSADRTFIVEIFAGCVRYKKVLDVVVKQFYVQEGRVILSSMENLFRALAYIMLFRLSELGWQNFTEFIATQKIHLMHKFVSFLSNEKSVLTWMKDAWTRQYDPIFVNNEIIEPFARWLPMLNNFVKEMNDKIENKVKKRLELIQPTKKKWPSREPKPFQLTQPQPRSVPMPELIPEMDKAMPVPDSTYDDPKEMQLLHQIKIDNRKRAEELLKDANKNEPKTLLRSKKAHQQQDIGKQSSAVDAKRSLVHKARPVPDHTKQEFPIKLNTAAILREWKLYKEAEHKDFKKLKDLEAGAFSLEAFQQWQNSIREADLAKQLADVERRRLVGQLSREEAILARRRFEEENKEIVEEMRRIMAEKRAEFEKQRLVEAEQIRAMVDKVLATHDQSKLAMKSVQEEKQKLVKELQAQALERQEMALAEAEADLRRKMALINEIRAMEATTPARGGGANLKNDRLLDFASIENHGLLLEMSLLELRERLTVLKEQQVEECEKKRDSILDAKQSKDERLMKSLHEIGQHRADKTRQAAEKIVSRKPPPEDLLQRHLNANQQSELHQLKEKLAERRQERVEYQNNQTHKRPGNTSSSSSKSSLSSRTSTNQQQQQFGLNRWTELDRSKETRVKMASELGKGSLVAKLDFLSA